MKKSIKMFSILKKKHLMGTFMTTWQQYTAMLFKWIQDVSSKYQHASLMPVHNVVKYKFTLIFYQGRQW